MSREKPRSRKLNALNALQLSTSLAGACRRPSGLDAAPIYDHLAEPSEHPETRNTQVTLASRSLRQLPKATSNARRADAPTMPKKTKCATSMQATAPVTPDMLHTSIRKASPVAICAARFGRKEPRLNLCAPLTRHARRATRRPDRASVIRRRALHRARPACLLSP